LKTSARNRLLGTVEAVHAGAVNDEIVLRIAGGQRIAAVITRASTEELGLGARHPGHRLDQAQAVLKTSARNRLLGTVEAVHAGAVNDEIVLRIAGG
ncbi:molybdenum-dependent transcriptional regulator, partial [Bordetella pertussis]